MSKRVISVRLSDEVLSHLDVACQKLGMNRSEAISAAVRILPELISNKAELTYDPKRLIHGNH